MAADAVRHPRSVLQDVKELDKPVSYSEIKIPLGVVECDADEIQIGSAGARIETEPVGRVGHHEARYRSGREYRTEIRGIGAKQWRT